MLFATVTAVAGFDVVLVAESEVAGAMGTMSVTPLRRREFVFKSLAAASLLVVILYFRAMAASVSPFVTVWNRRLADANTDDPADSRCASTAPPSPAGTFSSCLPIGVIPRRSSGLRR